MANPILHHYDLSPYSEKIRLVFGVKHLRWQSVQIPMVMPKPDYTELTGGYRRAPSLQLGADVYCDSKACVQALEALHPEPSLFPDGDAASVWGLAREAEASFLMVVMVFFGLGGVFDEAFVEDRKKMVPGLDIERIRGIVPAKLLQLAQNLERLEGQLDDGRAYLMGPNLCLADLAAFHTLQFMQFHPATAAVLEPHEALSTWMERVRSVGHGERQELDAADAIEIARAAEPAAYAGEPASLPDGLAYGDAVFVMPEEPGSGGVTGRLEPSGVDEIAIRRETERAGDVVVHFPRAEYLVIPA
ncbi:MAG: glutathione S-transferase family protein [Myxococcota bacterium]